LQLLKKYLLKIKLVLLFFVLTQTKVTKEPARTYPFGTGGKSRLTGIFCKSYDLILFPEKELIRQMADSNSFFLAQPVAQNQILFYNENP